MRNIILVTILTITTSVSLGQILYSDNFDMSINNFSSSTNIATSLNNNSLQIDANGNTQNWENIIYDFHNSGTGINIDASTNPKLFLKIKANEIPELRIDLIDQNGYVTNADPSVIYPGEYYQILEIDYINKLEDFGSGACTSGPCPVDASQLTGLMLFFNPGIGNYNGIIHIDWISLGEPLEPIPDYEIRYNQVGYFTDKEKVINIVSKNSFSSKNYEVLDANQSVVLSGNTTTANYWIDSDEYIAQVDISSLNVAGTYKFKTDDLEETIIIGDNVYQEISKATLKYYYFNRASTEINASNGGVYARNAGHIDTQVIIHNSASTPSVPTGSIISSPKGWYDAGDYNKYIVNSGISTYTLLAAFEHYEEYYEDLDINIPESNGNIPDVLAETKWNLDWMLSMQNTADGSVYHKLTGLDFSGEVLPEDYTFDRYVVGRSTSAALNFAAVMAVASRIFEKYTDDFPNYSATLLSAAESAYTWAKNNPTMYFTNPSDVYTGPYDDTNVEDEFQWAAVELFITTQNQQYKNDININILNNSIPSWQSTESLALISIAHHQNFLTNHINVNTTNNLLIDRANLLKTHLENNLVPTSLGHQAYDYIWGSNSVAANQIIFMLRAYELNNDETFLNAAIQGLDYILGNNGTGHCYVTGFGTKLVLNPHHRISRSDDIILPVPGMLVGGPHPGQQDSSSCFEYPNNYNASSYADNWCSFATNEVTINWNAPLTYALNAIHYYQTSDSVLNVNTLNNITDTDLSLYPNPTSHYINVNSEKLNFKSISLYNTKGVQLYSTKSNKVDLSSFNKGIYFLKILSTDGTSIFRKIIKK